MNDSMQPNYQLRDEPNAQRAGLRLEAEQIASASAHQAWADYHTDERRYTAATVAETYERARAFLAASVTLPTGDAAASDRRLLLSAGLAALCDGVHAEQRKLDNDSTAPQANAQIVKIKDALLKLLAAMPDDMPRGFSFLARSVLRPAQDALARQRMLAHLRHAQAFLVVFGAVTHDAPTDRI